MRVMGVIDKNWFTSVTRVLGVSGVTYVRVTGVIDEN